MNHGGDERLVYLWRCAIPALASQHEVVLDSMLAIAAIHLHSQAVDDSRLPITIPKYLDRVLINHRRNLLEPDGETAEPIFLTSALLSKIMWLVCHLSSPDESYKLPLAAYYVMRGANAVFSQRRDLLKDLGYIWLADEDLLPITQEITVKRQSQLDDIEEEMRSLFISFNVSSLPSLDQTAYHEASRHVLQLYKAYFGGVSSDHLQRLIVLTPLKVHLTFFTLLERNDALAMALFARALVLSSKVGGTWWLRGSGKYEVVAKDLVGMHTLMPPQYDFALDWPRKVLSGEIVL
ncbi:hypothetical protein F5884DRAFT_673060 [Xylogone sp. PMI_703]|nr:hypothetical protein F5884DRAFT_673060 [Xylogone sp. PMI_703]